MPAKKPASHKCSCEQFEERVKLQVEDDVAFARSLAETARQQGVEEPFTDAILAHIAVTRRDMAGIRALEDSTKAIEAYMRQLVAKKRSRRR